MESLAAEEFVAIVDRTNRVIGSATRRRMRAEKLPHRSTFILVFDSLGRLCVQKRTVTKDLYPGFWDPVTGGVVLAGESYEAGAARELHEELGIQNVALAAHYDFFFEDGLSCTFGRVFSCTWDGPVICQPEEVQFVEQMPPEEILRRASTEEFTPDGLMVVERWLKEHPA